MIGGGWLFFAACDKKEILPVQSQLDTTEPVMNSVDRWISDSLTTPYNIDVRYKWDEWNLSDMGKYNYPATPGHANILLHVLKHTWLDAYVETAGETFIKHNSPRQFTMFGGVDLTPNGTGGAWGQASGGINVLLFNVNALDESDLTDVRSLQSYAGLMHHEFTHILNQNVPFDEENYQKITPEGYTAQYHLIPANVSREEGFISSYARMNIMEDFAEMVSFLVTRSRTAWDAYVNQEVVKYAKQRDDFINGLPQYIAEHEKIRSEIAALSATIAELYPSITSYPDYFGPGDGEERIKYLSEVFVPLIRLMDPIGDFISENYYDDYYSGNQTTYRLYLEITSIMNNPDIINSPALFRSLLDIFSNSVIPYMENRFAQVDVTTLLEVSENLEKATRGRDKIREKERFIVEYFKSKLDIDLYELQANTFKKLSTPVTIRADKSENVPAASALVSHREVRQYLTNSRFHVCSWEKQSHTHK